MKPTKYFQQKEDDCLTAAVATLLQIDPKTIPDFGKEDDWDAAYKGWLLTEHNVYAATFDWQKEVPCVMKDMYYCLGVLQKEAKEYAHTVVLKILRHSEGVTVNIWHDPLGDKTCYDINDLSDIELFVNFKDALTETP